MTNLKTDPPTLKILIIDDEPLARHWLRMQLNKTRYTITLAEAASAALALQWLEKNTCHVILLDIHMPETDGIQFTRQLQAKAANQHITPAIIFVTADSSYALQAFELAAFDYLTKPVSVERLEEALARVINRGQLISSKEELTAHAKQPYITVETHAEVLRIPIQQILYFYSESKCIKVVTTDKSYLIDQSLNTLETQFQDYVIRIHRSFLVVKQAIEKLLRNDNTHIEIDASWAVKLRGSNQLLPISRRQLTPVKELLQNKEN